ncbi:hypothetical protein N9Y92_00085 [Chlamydiales bacterium]|nr:hypothetical protein [Chlamydiales bacterium]
MLTITKLTIATLQAIELEMGQRGAATNLLRTARVLNSYLNGTSLFNKLELWTSFDFQSPLKFLEFFGYTADSVAGFIGLANTFIDIPTTAAIASKVGDATLISTSYIGYATMPWFIGLKIGLGVINITLLSHSLDKGRIAPNEEMAKVIAHETKAHSSK